MKDTTFEVELTGKQLDVIWEALKDLETIAEKIIENGKAEYKENKEKVDRYESATEKLKHIQSALNVFRKI